jgi:hypothetical protein
VAESVAPEFARFIDVERRAERLDALAHIPVRCDQTGSARVQSLFAVGSPNLLPIERNER